MGTIDLLSPVELPLAICQLFLLCRQRLLKRVLEVNGWGATFKAVERTRLVWPLILLIFVFSRLPLISTGAPHPTNVLITMMQLVA